MKKITIVSVLLLMATTSIQGQGSTFRDSSLERQCSDLIKKSLYYEPEARATILVCESGTGVIKALVSTNNNGASVTNDEVLIHPPHYRALLFLALLENGASASAPDTFYAPTIYRDATCGVVKGYSEELPLYRAMDCSDTSMLCACETQFDCNPGALAVNLRHAGAFLGDDDQTESDEIIYERYRLNRWPGSSILGYNDYYSIFQLAIWMGGVANRGKMPSLRLSPQEPYNEVYSSFSSQDNIDCLRAALRQSVIDGMSRKANSTLCSVSGLTNVYVDEENGGHISTFLGFMDETNQLPAHTICVIVKGGRSISGDQPCTIAKEVLEWIIGNNKVEWHRSKFPHGVD